MKYAVITFGCKVNQYESTAVGNAMNKAGFEYTEEQDDADIVIVNSCTVTENSDKKAKHAVRAIKNRNPGCIAVLTGCYPQAFPDEAKESGADIITGTGRRGDIPRLITEFVNGRKAPVCMELPKRYEELDISRTTDKTRAFIKIEDGCDRFCSYCIIPYARGRVRSRTPESVAEEAALCADEGHREIVLVGINLSRYGIDNGFTLADAVRAASMPEKILRVRLSSLEPELLDERTVSELAGCAKLCPHFHLSLQSGCDATLKRMNRHYTAAEYLDIVTRLRNAFPDCSVTTDIMVGFAGETDEEFEQSLAFAEKVGFAKIHVFTYSVRAGTAAEKRTDHVPESVKRERYERMSELASVLRRRYFENSTGRECEVLVQKRTSPDFAAGLTPDYIPVRIYGSSARKHDIVKVRLVSAGEDFCEGIEI